MRQIIYFLILIFFFCFSFIDSRSQLSLQDSSFYKTSTDSLISFYKSKIGENLQLYSGEQYIRNGRKAKGFPFFGSSNSANGSVFYNGKLYDNLQIYFDLTSNDVIINNYTNTETLRLIPEKIKYFSLLDHHFIHLIPDEMNNAVIQNGFYDQLCEGKATLYARREKQLLLSANTEEEAKYTEFDYYFIKLKNAFYKIEDEHSLLELFADKKDELKKFIKTNKLSFKKHTEEAIVKTTDHYNQLTN